MKLIIAVALILLIASNMSATDKERLKEITANVLQSMANNIKGHEYNKP